MNATPDAAQQRILDAISRYAAAFPGEAPTVRQVRDLLELPPTGAAMRTVLVRLESLVTAGHVLYDPTTRTYQATTLEARLAAATRRRQEAERRALEAQHAVERAAQDEMDLADEMVLRDRRARQG